MSNVADRLRAFAGKDAPGRAAASDVFHANLTGRMTAALSEWQKNYPDIEWKVDKVLEKGDRAAFRYTASGKHKDQKDKASWSGSGIAILFDMRSDPFVLCVSKKFLIAQ